MKPARPIITLAKHDEHFCATTKPMMAIAQYFMVLKAFTADGENTWFCPAYPNTLNA